MKNLQIILLLAACFHASTCISMQNPYAEHFKKKRDAAVEFANQSQQKWAEDNIEAYKKKKLAQAVRLHEYRQSENFKNIFHFLIPGVFMAGMTAFLYKQNYVEDTLIKATFGTITGGLAALNLYASGDSLHSFLTAKKPTQQDIDNRMKNRVKGSYKVRK